MKPPDTLYIVLDGSGFIDDVATRKRDAESALHWGNRHQPTFGPWTLVVYEPKPAKKKTRRK